MLSMDVKPCTTGTPSRLGLLILVAMTAATAAVILALPLPALAMPTIGPDISPGPLSTLADELPWADTGNLAPPILDSGASFTVPVCISITYQGHGARAPHVGPCRSTLSTTQQPPIISSPNAHPQPPARVAPAAFSPCGDPPTLTYRSSIATP